MAKGSVKGKVVKADGSPAAGAEVRLTPRAERTSKRAKAEAKPTAAEADKAPAKRPRPQTVAHGKTDENGNFTLPDVAAGTYTISARLKDAGTARQNLTVHGTSATEVTLTLKQRVVRSKPRKPAA